MVVKVNVVKMTVCVAVVKSVNLTVVRAEVNAMKMTSLVVAFNVGETDCCNGLCVENDGSGGSSQREENDGCSINVQCG